VHRCWDVVHGSLFARHGTARTDAAQVYPAAGYAAEVAARGGTVAVFNLERSAGDEDADFLFLGPCEETLPEALGMQAWV
jgi:NAD-dependent SIR2 family protein deacetylase